MVTKTELIEAAKEVLPFWSSTPPFTAEQLAAYEEYFKTVTPQNLLDAFASDSESVKQ